MYRIVTSSMLALAFTACATEHTITGKVVDTRGRPVDQALITVAFREPHLVSPDVERVLWLKASTGRDGTFRVTTKYPVADLALSANSPDLKKGAVLPHIQSSDNLLVIR